MKRHRLPSLVIVALFLVVPLAATDEKPLLERIVAEDGDMKNVLIWQWLNDLTKDNAAVVLTTTGDLARISLPRAWRRGQTIGQVVRNAELFLGRFRVRFEERTLTLISLTADEMMRQSDYRQTVDVDEWHDADGDAIPFSVELCLGPMQPSNTETSRDSLGAFGAGVSFGLAGNWLAGYGRIEFGSGQSTVATQAGDMTLDNAKINLVAGARWLPFARWFVAPYLHAALLYGVYSEKIGADSKTWGGPGFTGGAGVQVGPLVGFSLRAEFGHSVTLFSSGRLECDEFRVGLGYAL